MCNDYEQHVKWKLYQDDLTHVNIATSASQGPAALRQADDIKIAEPGPVLRIAGNGVEVVDMKFGFPAARPKRPRVFNFISEKRDFSNSQRCAIVASAFFEFTGKTYPKAKHRFTLADQPLFFIAGLWRDNPDDGLSFTMLTTGPGADIAPYHDRQIVVLPPDDLPHWLYLSRPQGDLLRPLPAGTLLVETVRAGSDSSAHS
ncbi:SOS response-associated peptidase family protein [Asticcacaulis taihuensis]|uniref:SOS response-associated peptidase family protein n=1 Tax=Asticcacaulis taihuensis TaxID=260084 RepID=UPI0026EDFA77|nr:SOS response-associated peptidase family protein [Asticcacaulis taihuensis]